MKKLFLFLSAVTLILSSCSNDGDTLPSPVNSNNSDSVFLKKKVDSNGIIFNYTYNGSKIVSVIDNDADESDAFFTYTGDLITKLEYKIAGNVEQRNIYEYNAEGKLISFKRLTLGMNWGDKEVYTYNSDGSISFINYFGDATTQTSLNRTGKKFFTNGEVSRIEMYESGGGTNTITTTYDIKKNPMKNVLGWNKIDFVEDEAIGINHNVLVQNSTINGITNYSYIYNTNDYPKSFTETNNGIALTSECFY